MENARVWPSPPFSLLPTREARSGQACERSTPAAILEGATANAKDPSQPAHQARSRLRSGWGPSLKGSSCTMPLAGLAPQCLAPQCIVLYPLPCDAHMPTASPRQTAAIQRGQADIDDAIPRGATTVFFARTDEIVHVFRPCRPLVGAKRRQQNHYTSSGRHGQGRVGLAS